MSEYKGTFTAINNTGATITNVVVQHSTSYWPQGVVVAPSLASGASTDQGQVITSTAETDYWTVSFISGAGVLVVGSNSCGFESSDNNGNVVIQLYPGYFSVVKPDSGSCGNLSYNTST
jgi:hypothetical protein